VSRSSERFDALLGRVTRHQPHAELTENTVSVEDRRAVDLRERMAEGCESPPPQPVTCRELGTRSLTRMTAAPRRQRPPPRRVEVRRSEWLTPHLVRVTFGGASLADLAPGQPTGHIKVFLPSAGESELNLPDWGPDGPVFDESQPRPTVRTYTPRRLDSAACELDVDFVTHAGGVASEWAAAARTGDNAAVAGIGRGYEIDAEATSFVIAGDESALPALSVLLEALPHAATVHVIAETRFADARIALPSHPGARVTWCEPGAEGPGTGLAEALAAVTFEADTRVWVATEAGAVRAIRRDLLGARGVAPEHVVTRGYWKLGESNHPDGDYATDA
jgi:NADPH-dependent ferric siderophore reductase